MKHPRHRRTNTQLNPPPHVRTRTAPQMLTLTPQPIVLNFFFNDPPTTEIYTLSLNDAFPISEEHTSELQSRRHLDAVFCLSSDVCSSDQIGRAHVCTPVTTTSRMPSSA